MKTYLLLLPVLILLVACGDSSRQESSDSLPAMIEPFAIESYEFEISDSDTVLKIILNRDVGKEESGDLRIELTNESEYAFGLLPFDSEKTKNGLLEIQLPISDTSRIKEFPTFGKNGNFMKMIRKHLNDRDSQMWVDLRMGIGNVPNNRFVGSQRIYWIEDALEFNILDTSSRKVNRFEAISPWRKSLFKNFKGNWDKQDRKQGLWKWYYSNNSLMATATFDRDSIISPFMFYYYTGELQDSVSFSYTKGKRRSSVQTFYKNGELKQEKGQSYDISYGTDGEVIKFKDYRNCDSVELSEFRDLSFKTADGRDFLYADSLETIFFFPDISHVCNCITSSTVKGFLHHDLTNLTKGSPIRMKAVNTNTIDLTFSIRNIDTTVENSFRMEVKNKPQPGL